MLNQYCHFLHIEGLLTEIQPAVITDLQSHALGYFSGSVLLSIKRATAMGAYKLTFIKVGQWIYLPILLVRFIGSSGSLI